MPRTCLKLTPIILALASLPLAPRAQAGPIALDASASTFIDTDSNGGGTHGTSSTLWVGNSSRSSGGFYNSSYILLRWDLSAYAGRTVVGDATFTLELNSGPGSPYDIFARQVLVDWDPATANYANFGADRANDFTPSVGAVVSTASVEAGGSNLKSWTLGRDLLQSWIDSPSTNHGLFLAMGQEAFFSFASGKGTFGEAPRLDFALESAAVPEPASAMALGAGVLILAAALRRR